MYKIITLLLTLLLSVLPTQAKTISDVIRSLNINSASISISIRDVNSGNVIYKLNDKTPINPASTLKLVTSSAAYDELGSDYQLSTKLYKSVANDLYIKLTGDPFLKSSDLNDLMSEAVKKKILSPKRVYVDASVFDDVEWGEGWQWDDDLNPYMPKYSAYNLDKNLINLEVVPSFKDKTPAVIKTNPFYPVTVMNLVNTDYSLGLNNVKITRNNSIAPNVLSVEGTVSKANIFKIPVNSPKNYFKLRLQDAIRAKKIEYYDQIIPKEIGNTTVYLAAEVNHDIDDVMADILKSSDNLAAESLFKLAGASYKNSVGTSDAALEMLTAYLNKLDLANEDIRIVDGSGVSKNNILNADFMTKFLVKKAKLENFDNFREMLPSPGEGTLQNRMLYFKDNLRAKTGTLSNISAIAGYIVSRRGKLYAFDIMIHDAKSSSFDKKNAEELILRILYERY